jgi:hypothetical protein
MDLCMVPYTKYSNFFQGVISVSSAILAQNCSRKTEAATPVKNRNYYKCSEFKECFFRNKIVQGTFITAKDDTACTIINDHLTEKCINCLDHCVKKRSGSRSRNTGSVLVPCSTCKKPVQKTTVPQSASRTAHSHCYKQTKI